MIFIITTITFMFTHIYFITIPILFLSTNIIIRYLLHLHINYVISVEVEQSVTSKVSKVAHIDTRNGTVS